MDGMRQYRTNPCRSLVGGQVGESKREDYLFYCNGYPVSFNAGSLTRGEGRAARGSSLRNPVYVVSGEKEYLFTQAEWERAEESGKKLSRTIKRIFRQEVEEKVKMSLKLSCHRTTRLILTAAQAAGVCTETGAV